VDCHRVDEELVAFHLAALDGATRAGVEAHLAGCARCVSAYLALKRAADAGEEGAAPSELTRARIAAEARRLLAESSRPSAVDPQRAAAAARAQGRRRERRMGWAMAAALAALMLAAAPLVWRATHDAAAPARARGQALAPAPSRLPLHEAVDTARSTPETLSYL
jgi:hypothetical protein